MVDNSIAAELLQQINLTKIRPTPNYLSPADALTVEEFEQSEYGGEYTVDVSNIVWGNASNDSHRTTSSASLLHTMTAQKPG